MIFVIYSPDVREFFSLDNPKNAETNDDDDQPGADESSDSQVTNEFNTVHRIILNKELTPFKGSCYCNSFAVLIIIIMTGSPCHILCITQYSLLICDQYEYFSDLSHVLFTKYMYFF